MSTVLVIVLLAVACIACIAGLLWAAAHREEPHGRHSRPHEGRHELADPADRTDPGGDAYVEQLRGAGRLPYRWDEDEADAAWWSRQAPEGAVEILTGPGTRIAQTSELAMNVLTRVRDSLRTMATTPAPDEHEPDTGRIPHAVRTWGGKTAPEVAAELAERYLT